MLLQRGKRTPKMRGERERLTVHRPQIENALAGITFDGFDLAETRQFGNRLQAEAVRWMLRGGFSERGRIDKGRAHRMFALAFERDRA